MGWFNDVVKGATDVGLAVVTGGSSLASDAARKASGQQQRAAQAGIDEIRAALAPYVEAGALGLDQYQALLGLLGGDRQTEALTGIESSPVFQEFLRQGEQGILANASATGMLRGGDTASALAELRPSLFASEVERTLNRLGSLTTLGQTSATGSSGAIADLLGIKGAAKAGGTISSAAPWVDLAGLPAKLATAYFTGGASSMMPGGGPGISPSWQSGEMTGYGTAPDLQGMLARGQGF